MAADPNAPAGSGNLSPTAPGLNQAAGTGNLAPAAPELFPGTEPQIKGPAAAGHQAVGAGNLAPVAPTGIV